MENENETQKPTTKLNRKMPTTTYFVADDRLYAKFNTKIFTHSLHLLSGVCVDVNVDADTLYDVEKEFSMWKNHSKQFSVYHFSSKANDIRISLVFQLLLFVYKTKIKKQNYFKWKSSIFFIINFIFVNRKDNTWNSFLFFILFFFVFG